MVHAPVTGSFDILDPHSAELSAGVAIPATAIDTNTAAPAAAERTNNLMVGLPEGPSRP